MTRRYLVLLLILVLISPIFGVWLAGVVNYAEPLDHVAEALGLNESSINWTPFKDYTVPGLPDWAGYIVAGLMGVAVFVAVTLFLERAAKGRK